MSIKYADQHRTRVAEIRAARTALKLEGEELAARSTLTPTDEKRVSAIIAESNTLREESDMLADRANELDAIETERNAAPNGGFNIGRRTSTSTGPDEDRGRATVDAAHRSGHLPDHAAEKATALIENGLPGERSLAGRWAAAAGAHDYRGAFAKLAADPERGHLLWTPQEHGAYQAVAAVQSELSRAAMSTTAANGGSMIPLTLDPAIMLTNAGSNNPLRQLATVRQTMTNSWTGITSAGATSEWKAEGAQAADGAPTLGAPSIPVFMGDSYVEYSYEVGMDAENFLDELVTIMFDSADNLMAAAYTTGNGTTAPQGIVTGLAGTASEINGTGSEALIDADIYALQNALPARFSANASWQSHIATANSIRRFETTNGALEFPELRNTSPSILGKPWYENSNMDGVINAAASENNFLAIYGDIARAFFIVDRVGSTLEFIANVVGADRRPTTSRGALLWFRTGSEVVNVAAARLLDVPTTA